MLVRIAVLLLTLALSLPVSARIHHIVMVWLKPTVTQGQLDDILEATALLGTIPGVVSFSYGEPMHLARPLVDNSYSLAISMTFADEKAMRRYLADPTQVGYVKRWIKPVAARVVVYDYNEEVTAGGPVRAF